MVSNNTLSKEDIQKWLLKAIATELKIKEENINLDNDIADYGLDSLASATIISDMEIFLKRDLPATLLWDYSTINEMSVFIIELINSESDAK